MYNELQALKPKDMADKIKKGLIPTELEEILFEVFMQDNPRKTNKEYSKVVVGVIDGEEWDLNYCSDVYTLIPNKSIFPEIERVLTENNVEHTSEYTHINNVRFYADITITDERYAYTLKGTNDKIMPSLKVQHSYNGLTKYKIHFGYFRLVCSNGLVIPIEEMNHFNLSILGKHTDSILKSFDKLDSMLKFFTAEAKGITERITAKFEILRSRIVTDVEKCVTDVFEKCGMNLIDNSKFSTMNYITAIVREEANKVGLGYKGKVNEWLVYNAINQYLNDNDLNIATPEVRHEKDSKVFEYLLSK